MKSLKELNERVWYRALKIFFLFLYLPCILVVYLVISDCKIWHPPELPKNIKEALSDTYFRELSDWDKRSVLEKLDSYFAGLSYSEQDKVIRLINSKENTMKHQKIEITLDGKLMPKFKYASSYTYDIKAAVIWSLVIAGIYFLTMEIIRRIFYYIVLGKVFPIKG